jgi:cytochrome d ubiquinol oxidase subunit II
MTLPLDYETLRLIWWLFLGILLIGFAVMDGFDLGVGVLLPFVARTDTERRVMINTIGPVWEGNQVWLILGGGAVFAAYPPIYAAAFSGFYLAMFLTLVALILRPVAFGNLLRGVPFSLDQDLRVTYDGGFLGLLNPLGLLAGLLSVAMLVMHGAAYLNAKTDGLVQERAKTALRLGAVATLLLFVTGGLWMAWGGEGYVITSAVDTAGPSNPLLKDVAREPGAWLLNYSLHPWTLIAPVLGLGGAVAAFLFSRTLAERTTVLFSGLSVGGIIATAGVSLFPFLMPSNLDPKSSLTAWDATSSHFTLFVMMIATLIFLPIILAYTTFVFRVLRGKVTSRYVEDNSRHLY